MSPPRLQAIVTLGPTHEPVDEVRFLGNRSSGRMGVEIAKSLAARGCGVRVLAGPCQPPGLDSLADVTRFRTAEDLRRLLVDAWPTHHLLVMAAAVADWGPAAPVRGKVRTSGETLRLELEPVPEILGSLKSVPGQFTVGFALEPAADLEASARAKLERKRADCVVANPLETMDAGSVEGMLLWPDGRTERPSPSRCEKAAFAEWLVERVLPAACALRGIR